MQDTTKEASITKAKSESKMPIDRAMVYLNSMKESFEFVRDMMRKGVQEPKQYEAYIQALDTAMDALERDGI